MSDELRRHHLSWEDFDAVASGSGAARVTRQLRRAEFSWRMLLIRALVEEVAKFPELAGPLPSPEQAWELLTRAQHVDRAAVDRVITHPYTGSWAGYTLRLLRTSITGVGPFWAHAGHAHSLAAAAAIHAGLDFEATVPAWRGDVILPTLGLARLGDAPLWTVAHVVSIGGRAQVSGSWSAATVSVGAHTTGWEAIPSIRVGGGFRRLSVRLDHVDPYRGPYEPLPPSRLTASELAAWRRLFGEAWELVVRAAPDIAEALGVGYESIAPQPPVLFRTPSASSSEAFGSAILGRPSEAGTLAAMLVHEFQHMRLASLLHITRLHEDDPRQRWYAPWRDDPRPLNGMLQGAYAFFGMTALWRGLARFASRRAAFEFAYHRMLAWRSVLALRRDPALTELGRRFLGCVAEVLGPWQNEPVPQEATAAATLVATDHRLGWRLRHVRPDPQHVTGLAEGWLLGRQTVLLSREPTADPTPVPDGPWSHARADLVRLAMSEPANGDWTQRSAMVPDATPADIALVAGESVKAIQGYLDELAEDPDRPASWAGLALALSARGVSRAGWVLVDRPELVRAVHRRLRASLAYPPEAEELADWIGRVSR